MSGTLQTPDILTKISSNASHFDSSNTKISIFLQKHMQEVSRNYRKKIISLQQDKVTKGINGCHGVLIIDLSKERNL